MSVLQVIIIFLLYFSAAVSLNVGLVSISLYAAIPLSFLLSLKGNGFAPIQSNRYFKLLLLLYLWTAITAIFAINIDSSIRQFNQIIGVIILYGAVVNLAFKKKLLPWLYGLYIILFLAVSRYVYDNLYTIMFDVSTSRIGDDKLNTNTIAYYAFYLTCSLYMIATLPIKKVVKCCFRLMFLMMIPLSFFIAIFTASRQVLIIQIPIIVLLTYFRYFFGSKYKMRYITLGVITTMAIVYIYSDRISDTYEHSYLKERSERNVKEDPRISLMKEAFDVGMEHPLTGVGPGNFSVVQREHMFSHCSYTELFANSGIIAVSLYIYILLSFINRQYKNYKRYRSNIFLIFCVIGVIFFFYNFFYVFYIDLWLMSFFALITCHAKTEEQYLKQCSITKLA